MPVSSTATSAFAEPCVSAQADWMPGTPRRRLFSALALLPPTGCSHHWPVDDALTAKYGSFGTTCKRRSRSFGTTHSTSGLARSRCASMAASGPVSRRPKSRCWAARPTARERASLMPAERSTRRTGSS